MKPIFSSLAPAAIGPYSQAIATGNMLFISGQIPVDQSTGNIADDIEAQTRQCMENLGHILKEAKLDFSDVVRCGIFLKDMNQFAAMNEVYASYFKEPFPARAAVEVARLPKDVLIEIDAIAIQS